MAVTLRFAKGPTMATGAAEKAGVGPGSASTPLPSCPFAFIPQHSTAPSAERAQEWLSPAATATMRRPATGAATGVGVGVGGGGTAGAGASVAAGSTAGAPGSGDPSWPSELSPQQYTWPAPEIAQVWFDPVAMEVHSAVAAFAAGAVTSASTGSSSARAVEEAHDLTGRRDWRAATMGSPSNRWA
ncbi:unannotated protein [freshwater metagenome]|uniref:Unannotated protein n=1 Tax=freshwater metagenome TaxID=449393 RepID=A0A6J7QPI5_9ZZZZ